MLRPALLVVVALAAPAAAEPRLSVRAAGATGALKELTWSAPEIDFVGTFGIGARGFVAVAAGYASLDNHTFLADGRTIRLAVAGGATLFGDVRAAATLGLEYVAYHADPDVLADHPDVDILESLGGLMPSAGFELAHPIGASTAIGVFTRVGLTRLTLFESSTGDARARLVLAGAFIELQIR